MDYSGLVLDKELMEEISSRISSGAHAQGFPIHDSQAAKRAIDEALSGNQSALTSSAEAIGLEAVMLPTGRPALLVNKGTFALAESRVIEERLEKSRGLLNNAISACGRVEFKNHPDKLWGGTGWLIKPNLFVTSRHVASELVFKDGSGVITFRRNFANKYIAGRIDLREESGQPDEIELNVLKVLHIEDSSGPDIALLQVDATAAGRLNPLKISTETTPQAYVAMIGYPGWDDTRNDPVVTNAIFKGIYGVKRLMPGVIGSYGADYVTHDCSCLGGCSGSPLIDLATGEVVGMHIGGVYGEANYAIPSYVLNERLAHF
jgi:endonuclease G